MYNNPHKKGVFIMKITDDEKLSLKTEMLVYGYKTYETAYFDSNEYKKLRATMLEHLPKGDPNRFSFEFLPKNEILKAGRFVIDKHFGKFDLRVPFANGDDMETQLVSIFGKNPKPEQYDEIIDYINSQVDLVRVTNIPVYLNTGGSKNGYVSTTYFYGNKIMEEDYFKKLPVCVREIGIEGNCDEEARCIYVHEMSHALLNRYKKNVRNKLNNEAFSIFMESVAADDLEPDKDFLDLKIFARILQTKQHVLKMELEKFKEESFLDILTDEKYILSTLHATALFDTYSKGSNKQKQAIDGALGEVITGTSVLENVFDYYGATLEKGSRIMQKQIQTYDKKYCK